MGKSKAKAKQAKGRMKETIGKAIDDPGLQMEGRGEQNSGHTHGTAHKPGERMKKPSGR
ncbi:CsbD family protein [Streptomyces sp. NPDC020681]|uniref:CsbD family protein n=1 Tax=Streptomyces sp. NPDC020681 TaxID=3365083 RepID=UPI0037BC7C9C